MSRSDLPSVDMLVPHRWYRTRDATVKSSGPFSRAMLDIFDRACLAGPGKRIRDDVDFNLFQVGAYMELTVEQLAAVNEQVRTSLETLRNLTNETQKQRDIVIKTLVEELKEIRDVRMAIVREVGERLAMLRDVQAFFLHKDYERSLAVMEHFVAVAKEFKAMKDSGVLDMVSDFALRLAAEESSRPS